MQRREGSGLDGVEWVAGDGYRTKVEVQAAKKSVSQIKTTQPTANRGRNGWMLVSQ